MKLSLFWPFSAILVIRGPLRVPGGPHRDLFWLLLLISCSTTQYPSNKTSPKVFNQFVKKWQRKQGEQSQIWPFSSGALHPLKGGGTESAPRYRELGNMAQTFFYLKIDIKSKLFTDANLSMTKKKISPQ